MAGIPPELDLQGLLAEDRFLRSLAGSLLGSESRAEDAAQHTWLRSLEHPRQRPGSLRAFLRRILTRHTLNLKREDHRRASRERSAARPEALPSAVDMAAREELRRLVGEAVLSLDEPYRTTIWLRFRDELPPREVARAMEVPVETVRTRTRRALEQLRQNLDSRYGNRRVWGAVLLPLLSRPRRCLPLADTAAVLGGVMMKKSVVAAVGALLLLFAAAGTWSLHVIKREALEIRESTAADLAPGTAQTGTAESFAAERHTLARTPSPSVPLLALVGTLMQADGSPAIGVLYWSWEEKRPLWTHVPDEPQFYSVPAALPEPEGHTDTQGAWRLSPGRTAVTFAPLQDILLTYELDASGVPEALSLPPFAQVRLRLEGARPDERWGATLYQTRALDDGELVEWGMHLLTSHEFGGRVVALSLRGREFELGGGEMATFDAIAGLDYLWEPRGLGLQMDRELVRVTAPAAESVSVVGRDTIVRLTVVDPGGTPAPVDGQVFFWAPEELVGKRFDLLHTGADLEEGQALLGWQTLPTDTELRALVVLADGEQLSTRFRIGARETQKEVSVTRGQGKMPSLILTLPEDADLSHRYNVFVEDVNGSWSLPRPWGLPFWVDSLSDPNLLEGADHMLILCNLPDGWRQLWVVTASGRIVQLDNPGSVDRVSSGWLPDTELEDIRLADVSAEVPEGFARARYVYFEVQLQTYSGRSDWHMVDSVLVDPERLRLDDSIPDVWRKWAPRSLSYRFTLGRGYKIDVWRK